MFRRVVKLLTNPKHYLLLAVKRAQQPLCYLFRDAPFFFQAPMDISPKSRWHNPGFTGLTGGFYPKYGRADRRICDLEPWDTTRRDMLILLLRTVVERNVAGDFAEVGVYKGWTAKLIHQYAPERRLHLFDTFEGFTDRGAKAEQERTGLSVVESQFSDTSLPGVSQYIAPRDGKVVFYKGYFPESLPAGFGELRFAFVHLDADLYEPTCAGLEFFYPRMNRGGMLVVHDYNAWPGARKAVDEFFSDQAEAPIPMPDKSGSALIVKQ